MRNRVLVVETSDAVREVIESILRQNGMEVISVSEIDRADEVVKLSKPDLMIVNQNLKLKNGTHYCTNLKSDSLTSEIPLLVVSNDPDLPDRITKESVIPTPLDPTQFSHKINFILNSNDVSDSNESQQDDGLDIEDDFIDEALGLDKLSVTDSEVMDQTTRVSKKKHNPTIEKLGDFDNDESESDLNDSDRVESLIISEDRTNISHEHGVSKQKKKTVSGTGQLEIVDDQFGLTAPSSLSESSDDSAHDYDWFVNSMKNDVMGNPSESKTTADDEELSFTNPSESVNPITSVPQSPKPKKSKKNSSKGVDKFIDEFKKEMEVLRSNEPESITIDENSVTSKGKTASKWQDKIEKLTPEEINIFTKQFTSQLADKIALKIAEKIDSQKLLELIKSEILKEANKKS